MKKIDAPIFLIGPGRSGTTLTVRILALHPDVTWFSGWTARFPQLPQLAFLNRLNNSSFLEKATRDLPKWPRPAEAYGIWDYCFAGFSNAQNDWTDRLPSEEEKSKLIYLVKNHLRWHGKKRFLTKYTGWPRIDFIRTTFPDARFIYIERDPRAVTFSYLKQKWGYKNNPHLLAALPMEERLNLYARRYLDYFGAKQSYTESDDYFELIYERLIEDPEQSFREICDYLELSFPESFRGQVNSWPIAKNTNAAWQQQLSAEMQTYLTQLLKEPLEKMKIPFDDL